ncbi:MAG TPA: DUF4232 domain-containing protein [Streptosporangiaceae bacterium]|nr:DUF4232 domain-containing protein [Streptosporangiaceae bacterium]
MNRAIRTRIAIVTTAVACAAVLGSAVTLAAAGAQAAPPRPASTPQCKSSNLEIWLGLNGDGAAAGTTYYPIEFTNNAFKTHTCYVSGTPTVYALNSKGQKIGPVLKGTASGKKITLKPGQTAYARIGIVDAGIIAGCGQTTGAALEVTPPGTSGTQLISSFTFPVCKNKQYMHSLKATSGVGVP